MRRMITIYHFNNCKRKISLMRYTLSDVENIRCVEYKFDHFGGHLIQLCLVFVFMYDVDIQIQSQN